jgi:hypothetical protein
MTIYSRRKGSVALRYWLAAAALLGLAVVSLFFTGGVTSKSASPDGRKAQEVEPVNR